MGVSGFHHNSIMELLKPHLRTAGLFLALTWVSIWGVSLIPFDQLPIGNFWRGFTYHGFCALLWLVFMRVLTPGALPRLRIRVNKKRFLITILIIAYFISGSFYQAHWAGSSLLNILSGLMFALFIGLNEDLFSRGLIFGLLEKYGIAMAAALQALHFGLLHFGNYVWGGQSLSYTSAQIVDAAAFGYLCCGLMIFTGSIWVPILFHGLSDFPMQLTSQAAFTAQVTGSPEWAGTLLKAALMVVVGAILIEMHSPKSFAPATAILRKFQLID
jgi:membrane protease YdiL (CAAX protease family)